MSTIQQPTRTPIVEQIAQKIRQRLGEIDQEAGFQTTASSVVRPTRLGGFSPDDYQIILTQGEKTENKQLSCDGNPRSVAWNQSFVISAELLPSKNDRRPIDLLRSTFEADIIVAFTDGQLGDWAQWDGLAVYSELGSATPTIEAETTISGVQLNLLVIYRVSETNPYELR